MRSNEKTTYEKPEMEIMQLEADIDTLIVSGEGDGESGDFNLFSVNMEDL